MIPPPSPRSVELAQHQRMVSNDWGESLMSAIDGAGAAKPAVPAVAAVKEEDEDAKKSLAPMSPVDSVYSQASGWPAGPLERVVSVTPSISITAEPKPEEREKPDLPRNPSRDSVLTVATVMDPSMSEFSWAASARLSVITAETSRPSTPDLPNNTLKRTPSTKSLVQIETAFNPTANPKRASQISTYSSIIAPAAAQAALTRQLSTRSTASRPGHGKNASIGSFISILNPSFSRPTTPAKPANRLSMEGTPGPAKSRPFSALSIAESAYTESIYSSRCSTPDAGFKVTLPVPKSNIALDEHKLVAPHVDCLKTSLLPQLDALLANTSILAHYSIWEKAMSLRREVRAFLAVGIEECVMLDGEGEVDEVKMDKLGREVKGFTERGEDVRRAAERQGMGEGSEKGKEEGKRVRSFWSEMGGSN